MNSSTLNNYNTAFFFFNSFIPFSEHERELNMYVGFLTLLSFNYLKEQIKMEGFSVPYLLPTPF